MTGTISSPTFVLMAEYAGRLPLFHVDLYRLADGADALAGGIIDERQAAGVTLVEWPDRMGDLLPARRLDVVIEGTGTEPRRITLRTSDPGMARYVAAVPARAPTVARRGRRVTALDVSRRLLAIDTSTALAVVALGGSDGRLDGADGWAAGYRHGEDLLPRLRALLATRGVALADLGGVIVGTGPGAFTGLRVGIATAKGIAHALRLPIAGVPSGAALLAAAADAGIANPVLLLPAGPNDTVLVRGDRAPERLPGGTAPALESGETLVAVDLDGRAPADALARGERARDGFAAALVRIGAERLNAGEADDLARLVPEYVTLPRGVAATSGEVAWSRDPR